MDETRMKAMLLLVSAAAMLSVLVLSMDSSDAEPATIDVVDSQGRSIGGNTSLINDRLIFETYTVNGQTTFFLEKGTEISKPDRFLVISTEAGEFSVSASIPNQPISGPLGTTGFTIILTGGSETFEATLTKDNRFSDTFKAGGSEAVLKPGQRYAINIVTAGSISGSSSVEDTGAFSIIFAAQATSGYLVEFYDGTTLIDSFVVEQGMTISNIPVLKGDETRTFDGWFDSSGNKFTSSTRVYSDMVLHSRWTEIEPEPPESETTTETRVIPNPDGTETIEVTETTVYSDGSSRETVTSTTDHKDGKVTVEVEEIELDPFHNERRTECVVNTTTNSDGTEFSE